MGLLINGITCKYDLPVVPDERFKYAAFATPFKLRVTPKGGPEVIKEIAVQTKINAAWRFITRRAAAHKSCNDYFKTLLRKKTLTEGVIAESVPKCTLRVQA